MPSERTRSSLPDILRRLKRAMGPLWWYGALLFAVSRLGDMVNLYVGAFLVPALVPESDLGAIPPLLKLAALVTTPVGLLVTPAEKYLNVFHEHGKHGCAKALLRDATLAALAFVALVAALFLLWPGPILVRLGISDRGLLVFAALLGAIGCVKPLYLAAARAFQIFSSVVWAGAPGPFVRLAALWLLARFWPLRGYLVAQTLSDASGLALVAWAVVRFLGRRPDPPESYRPYRGEMLRFAAPLVCCGALGAAQAFVEAFVIRHWLPPDVSAASYLIEMLYLIPFYFGDAVTAFLFPIISSRYEHGERTGRVLAQTMALSFLVGLGCSAFLFVVSPWVLSLRDAWRVALPFARLVPLAALGKTFRMAANCFVLHEQACRRFRFLWHYATLLALSSLGLYALVGWEFFQPWLPAGLWEAVAAWPRATLPFILGWGVLWNGLILLAILVQLWLERGKNIR